MAFDPSTAVLEFDPSSATEDDFSFDPSSAVDTTPGIVKDTYNRAMGGLTIGLTKAAAGTARWAEMVTKASSTLSGAISEKADIPIGPLPASAASELGGAVSKQFGSVAQTLEEKTKEFEAYKESQTDRSRDSKFSAQLVEAGGNFAGQIALTAAGRVPGIIANVGQMFEQEYSAAKAQGKDDLLAYQAGVSNMPAAFLDYFMESKIAKSLVPVKRTVGTVAKKLFTNAGLEGATEVLQDEYSNWIAGNALKYDESRSVQERFSAANLPETGKQIATTFAIGSILGGTATGAFEAIQPSQVDEKGLAKESRLDALQKELDLINETQEKAQISTTESSPIVPTTISETTGDTPATPVSEVARVSPEVRQEALDTEAEESLSAAERVLAEPTVEEPTQMSLGTSDAVPVAPITEKQPITQPKAIPGIPSETDLKKVDVLKRATDVIREGWQHAPQIEVVHDVTSIPDEAMTPAEKEAIQGKTADGLFGKDGKVYLIGQSVPSIQRAKEIILHETKAHYGFKSLFGSDESSYRKAMQSALDEFDARPKLADALAQRGGFKDLADLTQSYSHLNIEHKEGKYALTEELLSRAAEVYHDPAKERPTWFNRVISRIKVALQPLMPGMRLNDQDIVNLLGTKSTELLDVASQKVETGQADIPKFSIVKGFEPPEFIPIPFVDVGDRLTTSKSRNTGEEQEYLRFKTPVGWAKVLGSRLSGFVSKDKKILFGYDKNGQMFTVNPKDVKPSDVLGDHETANRLRDALGKMPFHSETGKAEIPKFSIGAPQLSLTRKQKQVDYYKNLATNQFPSIPEESANSLAKFLSENKTVMQSEEYLPDEAMQMAVRAYIRHNKTPYDDIFNEGVDKSENRSIVGSKIDKIYNEWRKGFEKPKEENIKPLYWAEYTKLDGTRNKIYSSSQELLRSKIEDAQKKHTNHDLNPVFGSDTETTKFSLTKTPAPAVEKGLNLGSHRIMTTPQDKTVLSADIAKESQEKFEAKFETTGWRVTPLYEGLVQVGDSIPLSKIWEIRDEEWVPTEVDSQGVSAFRDFEAALKYARYTNGSLYLVGGEKAQHHAQQQLLSGEVVIKDPQVLLVAHRENMSDQWQQTPDQNFINEMRKSAGKEPLRIGKEPAPAVHIGDQEFEGQKFPFFNLTEAIPGHSKDSTVSADTLIDAGYAPPEGYSGGFEKANLPMLSLTGHPQSDKILNDLNSFANKAKTKLFDDLNALAVVEKGLNLGKRLDATLSAWTAALQTRNIANVMKGVFTDGMIQYNSAKGTFEKAADSVGMQAIFEPLTKAGLMDKWDNYAKGKRAQTLVKQKLGVPWQAVSNAEVKKLTGFTKDEANQWISDGQADSTVVKSHQDYQKHNEKIRDFALQTGLISPQQKAAMDQLLDYVPFFREMDTEGNVKERGRAGLSGQSSGIKELKGSERNILPLLESITAQTSRIIDAGMKNIASQRAVAVMQAGGVAERVPTATQPVSKNLQSIQTDLSNLGVEFNKLPQSAKDQLTALMYGPQKQTTAAASDPNVVSVRVNGKLQYYKTEDPALAQALQSLSKPEENFFMMVLGKGKALQTVTATTNPGFAIANLIRDTLSTFVQSGDTKHLFRVGKGLVKSFQESPELKSIQQAGSGGSAFLNIDPKSIRDVLKSDNFWENRWNDKLFMKTVWSGWKQVLYAAENANRVAIYDKVIEQGGTPAEAAFQAQDTLNFQMHGASRSLQMLSAAIPFLNARMQGAYKIGRSGSADPKGVALRGGLLVLASLGLWALNKLDRSDEDSNGKNWYERLSNNDKALYWHIKVPGTNEIVRIPKPFEMGTLFATIPEVMADAIADPKELGRSAKIAGTSTAQALPVVGDFIANLANTGLVAQSAGAALSGNPLIRPFLELPANRNFFFNSPIVTNQNAPKQAQYNDRTSATARAIGDVTGASPQEADYVINTIFSGLTPYILLASDSVAKSAGYQGAMQKEAKDYLGIGRFTKDSETMSNRYTPDFYELKNQVDDTYAKARWMATEATEQAALQNFEKEKAELLAMRKPIQAAQKELKSIKEELSRVRGGSSSTDDKRSKEEALLKQRNEVLAKTMKFYQDLLEKKGRGRMP